jgi:hypothetical protein
VSLPDGRILWLIAVEDTSRSGTPSGPDGPHQFPEAASAKAAIDEDQLESRSRKALIPLENKRSFLEVSGDIMERVDPVFFSDPMTAAMKALGMT